MSSFPKLSGPPRPEFKPAELKKAEGKTIDRIEFGEVESYPELHESEAMIIHFTDGSALAIHIGSNAGNLTQDLENFRPQDMHTDLMVTWAPSIQKMTSAT